METRATCSTAETSTASLSGSADAEDCLISCLDAMNPAPAGFSVRDATTANWLVRKILDAREYAQRVKEWAEQELRRAEQDEASLILRFGGQLERWTREQLAHGRRKSLRLPAGAVGFRAITTKLVIDDERRVLEWAKENCPAAVVIAERLAKSVIDEHVATTGAIPEEGVHFDPECERFYIK